jgi:thiamine pyrophosphokinase
MKEAVIALKMTRCLPPVKDADYIGGDAGALYLLEQGIRPVLSVGDFDSVTPEEKEKIIAGSDEMILLRPIKDDSDSEHAVKEALKRGYERIWLCGGLGGRTDHTLVNLRLCQRYPGVLYLYDELNLIHAVAPGTYHLKKGKYPYVSFFSLEHARISLNGFFYPLSHYEMTPLDTLTVSNEITAAEGILTVEEGTVLILFSRDGR